MFRRKGVPSVERSEERVCSPVLNVQKKGCAQYGTFRRKGVPSIERSEERVCSPVLNVQEEKRPEFFPRSMKFKPAPH